MSSASRFGQADLMGSDHQDHTGSGGAVPAVLIDPRRGDIEDDAASPAQRSLLAIAGNLLVEVSLPKLLFVWLILMVVPAILIGVAPLVISAWLHTLSDRLTTLSEIGAGLTLVAVAAVGWIGWRPLFRMAETSFWSLNALAVQPGYAIGREGLRHLVEQLVGRKLGNDSRARLRSLSAIAAGVLLCAGAALIAMLAWPASRWTAGLNDLLQPHRLAWTLLANALVLISSYVALASLSWGFADATMHQPVGLAEFDSRVPGARCWRVAHMSDIHVVGERYGFRIESGRAGPSGNTRLARALAQLAAIHQADPLDHVLITGDMTDAGRASEWAEFLDALARHPQLAARCILLPGNHDLNIVDRANPARLHLPFSPLKRLRQMRALAVLSSVQGGRVRVGDGSGPAAPTLNDVLASYRQTISAFADRGGLRNAAALRSLFDDQFPMVIVPEDENGLGIAILNSNADTHFSFTNALGLLCLDQVRRLEAILNRHPKAHWIVALHHHLVEYPMPVTSFSKRIGTALINGSWFARKLEPLGQRLIVMHGHRHMDWIGRCGALKIISAPSVVMNSKDDCASSFYIHTLSAGPDGTLRLLPPQRVDVAGENDHRI
ncbi:metallophosphoesterase family protein [Bradyrhizobium sp. HKCCYLS1011]|uniref:metallophosphoesterase family protein n=1 Tax=Bradyrhizobium sp. HKCCYLS1011 TaxID=3420733 RepID=UPI003EBBDF79